MSKSEKAVEAAEQEEIQATGGALAEAEQVAGPDASVEALASALLGRLVAAGGKVGEPRITAADKARASQAEAETRKALLAERTVDIHIPYGVGLGPSLYVAVNGVGASYAVGETHAVPESFGRLLTQRIEAAVAQAKKDAEVKGASRDE